MNTPEILPQPASTYQLLLDAARTWPEQRRNAVDPRPRRLHVLPGLDRRRAWPAR